MEVAGGLVIAHEVISSLIEGTAVGAYALAKPTLPLKCKLRQFARAPEDKTSASLARKHHSVNVVGGDVYIFGGLVAGDKLAGNEVHILLLSNQGGLGSQYKCVPAIARDGESDIVPAARAGHTASVIGKDIVVFGGFGDPATRRPVDEPGRAWIFSTETLQWTHRDASASAVPRSLHAAVAHGEESLIVHGGSTGTDNKVLSDTWSYNLNTNTWTELSVLSRPEAGTSLPPSLAIANDTLYLISNQTSSPLSNTIYTLDLTPDKTEPANAVEPPPQWTALTFPVNPLTPGPPPRSGAGLATLYTGQGRVYLIYLLGAKSDAQHTGPDAAAAAAADDRPVSSSIWALQLSSPNVSGAGFKDAVRDKVGAATHEAEWAEVKIVASKPPVDVGTGFELDGKAHPGPRAYFGWDVLVPEGKVFGAGSARVLFWGGEDPSGGLSADGWVVEVETPSATDVLKDVPVIGRFMKGGEE